MQILLILIALITFPASINAKTIERTIDGDTFVIFNPKPPVDLLQNRGRLVGIDTPESMKQFAKCQKEIELGLKAKEFSQKFVDAENVEIIYLGLDKYGRYLISLRKNKKDLAEELVRAGLAVFYDGGTKVKNWCE
jgi:endonuclease YncB( thermonuclease family)